MRESPTRRDKDTLRPEENREPAAEKTSAPTRNSGPRVDFTSLRLRPALRARPLQAKNGRKRDRQKGLDDKRERLGVEPVFEPPAPEPVSVVGDSRDMESLLAEDESSVEPQDLQRQGETEQVLSAAFSVMRPHLVKMTGSEGEEAKQMRIKVDGRPYRVSIKKAPFQGKGSGAVLFLMELKCQVRKGKYRSSGSIVIKKMAPERQDWDEEGGFFEIEKKKVFGEVATTDSMSGHKHSPTFHGGYFEGGTYFVGMELGAGDLTSRVDGGAGKGDIRDWLLGAGKALAALHAANRTHGDIKGDNVLISKSGEAMLGDYGEAKEFDSSDDLSARQALNDDISRFIQMVYAKFRGMGESGQELLKALEVAKKSPLDEICIPALKGALDRDEPVSVSMQELVRELSKKSVWV